jgi:hypothetical protein
MTKKDLLLEDDEPSSSIPHFCELEDISLASYHKMQRDGYGPKEVRIPGTNIVRITASARREWHRWLEALPENEEIKAERSLRTSRAGKLAAQSPKHHCRRKRAS